MFTVKSDLIGNHKKYNLINFSLYPSLLGIYIILSQ